MTTPDTVVESCNATGPKVLCAHVFFITKSLTLDAYLFSI